MSRTDDRAAMTAYVRARLRREAAAKPRGYQSEVARRTGFSTAHVANLINREGQGIGIEAAAALATFWGMTLSQLTDEARADADRAETGGSSTPNLDAALDFYRSRGDPVDRVTERARAIAHVSGDLSLQAWVVVLSDLLVAVRI